MLSLSILSAMFIFITGLIVFLGIHSVSIVAPRWRDAQVVRLGEGPWKGLYSVVSLLSLIAMIHGYGIARQTPVMVYASPVALKHVAFLLMLPVFPLLIRILSVMIFLIKKLLLLK